MNINLGVLMDPIASIHIHKDTTFALLLEAQRQGYHIFYMTPSDIWFQDGLTWGNMGHLKVQDNPECWFEINGTITQPLVELDVLLMRKDPPFDMEYVFLTYLLEQAERKGLMVINKPSSLRDANEKLFIAWFPQCCPKTLVSSNIALLKEFVYSEEEIVVKPLYGMGGRSVFRVREEDKNTSVILETLTDNGKKLVMAQRFIPEISQGDKRILMINGEPVAYALARVPAEGDFRGNLAAGASGEGRELTDRDYWICDQVGKTLKEKGLFFVGLDVIGDYLTEINVTSPTCVRELDRIFNLNIAEDFFLNLEEYITNHGVVSTEKI